MHARAESVKRHHLVLAFLLQETADANDVWSAVLRIILFDRLNQWRNILLRLLRAAAARLHGTHIRVKRGEVLLPNVEDLLLVSRFDRIDYNWRVQLSRLRLVLGGGGLCRRNCHPLGLRAVELDGVRLFVVFFVICNGDDDDVLIIPRLGIKLSLIIESRVAAVTV